MAPKTDMTGRLLLLAAAAYALLSITSLSVRVFQARDTRDLAQEQVQALQSAIDRLQDQISTEEAAREKLKMVRAGERIILFAP